MSGISRSRVLTDQPAGVPRSPAGARPLAILGIGNARSVIFLRWAWRLRDLGHRVVIVSDRFSEVPDELAGLECIDLKNLGSMGAVRGVRRLTFGHELGRLARRFEIDVVHGHYLLPYGYWAATSRVRPLVVSPWGTDILIDGQRPGRDRFRARAALSAADAVVVNPQAAARAVTKLVGHPRTLETIVWYADLARFGPEHRNGSLRQTLGWPEDALVVLSLRNFRPDTNIDVIVRAFATVAEHEPRARLLLAAKGGPLQQQIEDLVTTLRLSDRVQFREAKEPELPSLVASADLLVAMTKSDSTPSSLLGAMASGLPGVCAGAASIDEWLEPGSGGEIVPQRDETKLAEATLRLLRDPELRARYGERNRQVIAARFSADGPGSALEELYRTLLARNRTKGPSRRKLALARIAETPLGLLMQRVI